MISSRGRPRDAVWGHAWGLVRGDKVFSELLSSLRGEDGEKWVDFGEDSMVALGRIQDSRILSLLLAHVIDPFTWVYSYQVSPGTSRRLCHWTLCTVTILMIAEPPSTMKLGVIERTESSSEQCTPSHYRRSRLNLSSSQSLSSRKPSHLGGICALSVIVSTSLERLCAMLELMVNRVHLLFAIFFSQRAKCM